MSFRKLFQIPGPKEMGIASSDALPMRSFTPECEGVTWEDYHELVAKRYPVRNFFANTVGNFIKYKIWSRIKDFKYWVVSYTVPSRRYHMLDLRQPCNKGDARNIDCYSYGWCDVPEKMLYAMFNLLKEYFDEEPTNLRYHHSPEEIDADPVLKNQQASYDEARTILHWWQVERKEERQVYDMMLHNWCELNKDKEARLDGRAGIAFDELNAVEAGMEVRVDEMVARLLKIRRNLWT